MHVFITTRKSLDDYYTNDVPKHVRKNSRPSDSFLKNLQISFGEITSEDLKSSIMSSMSKETSLFIPDECDLQIRVRPLPPFGYTFQCIIHTDHKYMLGLTTDEKLETIRQLFKGMADFIKTVKPSIDTYTGELKRDSDPNSDDKPVRKSCLTGFHNVNSGLTNIEPIVSIRENIDSIDDFLDDMNKGFKDLTTKIGFYEDRSFQFRLENQSENEKRKRMDQKDAYTESLKEIKTVKMLCDWNN